MVPSRRYLPETPFVSAQEAAPISKSPKPKLEPINKLLSLKKSRFFGFRNAVLKRNPNKRRQLELENIRFLTKIWIFDENLDY